MNVENAQSVWLECVNTFIEMLVLAYCAIWKSSAPVTYPSYTATVTFTWPVLNSSLVSTYTAVRNTKFIMGLWLACVCLKRLVWLEVIMGWLSQLVAAINHGSGRVADLCSQNMWTWVSSYWILSCILWEDNWCFTNSQSINLASWKLMWFLIHINKNLQEFWISLS